MDAELGDVGGSTILSAFRAKGCGTVYPTVQVYRCGYIHTLIVIVDVFFTVLSEF